MRACAVASGKRFAGHARRGLPLPAVAHARRTTKQGDDLVIALFIVLYVSKFDQSPLGASMASGALARIFLRPQGVPSAGSKK